MRVCCDPCVTVLVTCCRSDVEVFEKMLLQNRAELTRMTDEAAKIDIRRTGAGAVRVSSVSCAATVVDDKDAADLVDIDRQSDDLDREVAASDAKIAALAAKEKKLGETHGRAKKCIDGVLGKRAAAAAADYYYYYYYYYYYDDDDDALALLNCRRCRA